MGTLLNVKPPSSPLTAVTRSSDVPRCATETGTCGSGEPSCERTCPSIVPGCDCVSSTSTPTLSPRSTRTVSLTPPAHPAPPPRPSRRRAGRPRATPRRAPRLCETRLRHDAPYWALALVALARRRLARRQRRGAQADPDARLAVRRAHRADLVVDLPRAVV